MLPLCLWRVILHPASQSGPAPTRDLSMSSKMCASVAVDGRPVRGNCAVWVECMIWPFATCTATGVVAGWTLRRKVDVAKKCPVLPEARMMGGEGPSGVVTRPIWRSWS